VQQLHRFRAKNGEHFKFNLMVETSRQVRYCRAGSNGSFRRPTGTVAPDSCNKIAKTEISMKNPERINEVPPGSQHPNKLLAQQPADELM
jgi:hypothetical protein